MGLLTSFQFLIDESESVVAIIVINVHVQMSFVNVKFLIYLRQYATIQYGFVNGRYSVLGMRFYKIRLFFYRDNIRNIGLFLGKLFHFFKQTLFSSLAVLGFFYSISLSIICLSQIHTWHAGSYCSAIFLMPKLMRFLI